MHAYNSQYNQSLVPPVSPLMAQPQYNLQASPPYLGQWPQTRSALSNISKASNESLEKILQEQCEYHKMMQERDDACKECKIWQEEHERFASTRVLRKLSALMSQIQKDVYHG